MYGVAQTISAECMSDDWVPEIGKAKIEREGTDVSIITFSRPVGAALQAAELLAAKGISAEVINLRSLRPIDRDAIVKSVMKTHRLVTVEEGWPQCGIGAEICGIVFESAYPAAGGSTCKCPHRGCGIHSRGL